MAMEAASDGLLHEADILSVIPSIIMRNGYSLKAQIRYLFTVDI